MGVCCRGVSLILIKGDLQCPYQCLYCYQSPTRRHSRLPRLDLEAVERAVRKLYSTNKQPIVVHGGEPLLYPVETLERLFKLSYELTGKCSIQTSGFLLRDVHLELFKKYKVSVGLSIDGPWPVNRLRGSGDLENRKRQTEHVLQYLEEMVAERIPVSVISVAHSGNLVDEGRELFKQWMLSLDRLGVTGRFNPVGTDDSSIAPSLEVFKEGYLDILRFQLEKGVRLWSPYRDMLNSLLGSGNVVCVFRECDPYCTPSATTVFGDGSVGVCVRLYGGRVYLRDTRQLDVRSRVLRQTDCAGCEYWEHCKGGCCGLAVDWDWRNKDRYCEVYKAIFKVFSRMLRSLGLQETRREVKPREAKSTPGVDHTDGVEHLDGAWRHLDSNLVSGHSDGIEHLDGGWRHLDSSA